MQHTKIRQCVKHISILKISSPASRLASRFQYNYLHMSNVQKEAIIGVVSVIVTHLIVVPALKGLGGLFHRGGNKNVKKQEKKAVVAPTGVSHLLAYSQFTLS